MNKRIPLIALGGLLAALLAVISLLEKTAFASPLQQAGATATRRPTATATRRAPTPARRTPTQVSVALQNQLVFGGMGGGGGRLYCSPEILAGLDRLPGVAASERYQGMSASDLPDEFVTLCIFGVPFDKGFMITLTRPDGVIASKTEYRPGEKNTFEYMQGDKDGEVDGFYLDPVDDPSDKKKRQAMGFRFNNTPVIELDPWLPAGLPAGRWRAAVSAPGGQVEGSFDVPAIQPAPVVQPDRPPKYRFPNADPLGESQNEFMESGYYSYPDPFKAPASFKLFGAGFKPGSQIPLALYAANSETWDASLVSHSSVKADQNGDWQAIHPITSGDKPGRYILLVVLDPSATDMPSAGPYVEFVIQGKQPGTPAPPPPGPADFTAAENMFCREAPTTSAQPRYIVEAGQTWPAVARWTDSAWLLLSIDVPTTRTKCCWVSGQGSLAAPLESLPVIDYVPDRIRCELK